MDDHEYLLKFVGERLRELDEYIFPTFHKVFPKYAATIRRVDAILKIDPPPGKPKKN